VLSPFQAGIGFCVALGAVHDGLHPTSFALPSAMQTNDVWPVALVTAPPFHGQPYGDYHWLRRDDSGRWSHKTGIGSPASDVDDSGNKITDPVRCDRGEYVHFVGFFVVFRAMLKP
jgi:hypothetical protein